MAQHQARKRFGQHFLTDAGVIAEIVNAIHPLAGEHMLEIGPGLAAMTQPLVERVGHLQVIELDRDLAARLRQHAHLSVHEADVLKVDISALAAALGTSAEVWLRLDASHWLRVAEERPEMAAVRRAILRRSRARAGGPPRRAR